MRKDIVLPALALAGGAGGFFLRRWQLASAYSPETGLFLPGAPATWALLALMGLLVLVLLVLVRDRGAAPQDFLPAFGGPESAQVTVLTSAWILMVAAGGFGLLEGVQGLRLWRTAPEMYQFSSQVSQLLAGALCILAGFGVLLLGQMAYRGTLNDTACRLASFPALAGLVWLFSAHLKNGTEPVLMKYGFQMAAALLLTLAHYYIAAFLFGRPHSRRTVVLALMGAVFGLTSLADRPSIFTSMAVLAYSMSALTFARALLRGMYGPNRPERMPPPAEDMENDI